MGGYEQALFLDDSAQSIKQAQGICSTLRVSAQRGIDAENMRAIEQRIVKNGKGDAAKVKEVEVEVEDMTPKQPSSSSSMAMDITPARPKRGRSLFTANMTPSPVSKAMESECDDNDVMDMMTSFHTMSVRTKKIRGFCEDDDKSEDEESAAAADDDDDDDGDGDRDGTGGFLLTMF